MSEDQPTVTIPLDEAPIGLLAGDDERYAYFLTSYASVLRHYPQITPDSYWRLTVAEHGLMVRAIEGQPDGN